MRKGGSGELKGTAAWVGVGSAPVIALGPSELSPEFAGHVLPYVADLSVQSPFPFSFSTG